MTGRYRGGMVLCVRAEVPFVDFGHARGLTKEQLIAEAARSTLDELADWTVEADRVLTF